MSPLRIFISHAFEDKADFVTGLAQALASQEEFKVWYDEYELRLGDSLLESISKGLRESDYGIVVFSPSFFNKRWTSFELDGLFAKETAERKVILPIWHRITREDLLRVHPPFADRYAANSAIGIPAIVEAIRLAVGTGKRTQQLANPLTSMIEATADVAATRARSDELLDRTEGIEKVRNEVQVLFLKIEQQFEVQKAKLSFAILRNDDRGTITVRSLTTGVNFSCEYPTYLSSTARTKPLKLSIYREIFDDSGDFKEAQVKQQWETFPVFDEREEVLWQNHPMTFELSSTALLEHVIPLFLREVEVAAIYG